MRRISPYGTWVFARLGWSPNAVTWLMIVMGVGAGAVLAVGGLATAIAAAVMIQVYLLLDCSDGELARWSRRTSVSGIYLDRVGHYLAEAALLAGLGIRAQGQFALSGGYVSAGLAAAICAILIKAETDNVIVARAKAGLPVGGSDTSATGVGADAAAGGTLPPPCRASHRRRGAGTRERRPSAGAAAGQRAAAKQDHPGRRAFAARGPSGRDRRHARRTWRHEGAGGRLPARRGGDGGRSPGGDPGLTAARVSGPPRPGGERSADEPPGGERPADERPGGERPGGERPADERPRVSGLRMGGLRMGGPRMGGPRPRGGRAQAAAARDTGRADTVTLSCVIITMGDRSAELDRAVRSVLDQSGAPVETVVVANGAELAPLPARVRIVLLPGNVGIPAGRNAGAAACTGDVILFLDDDGWYGCRDLAAHVRGRFAADPSLAVLSFRVRDPAGGAGQRRHVPRLRAGDPERSSEVTTFLGGACAIRRDAYERAGGYPGDFFYAHEETDLAWRLLDAGNRLEYDADAEMFHPAVLPGRHAQFFRLNARNRVFLARRNLPWPVAVAYLFDWALLTLVRERSIRALTPWFAGFAEGWRADPGPRRPISWRTIWRMAAAGRPPLI